MGFYSIRVQTFHLTALPSHSPIIKQKNIAQLVALMELLLFQLVFLWMSIMLIIVQLGKMCDAVVIQWIFYWNCANMHRKKIVKWNWVHWAIRIVFLKCIFICLAFNLLSFWITYIQCWLSIPLNFDFKLIRRSHNFYNLRLPISVTADASIILCSVRIYSCIAFSSICVYRFVFEISNAVNCIICFWCLCLRISDC